MFRAHYGRILSILVRHLRDFDLAEESLQEAFTVAISDWSFRGEPENPAAWLLTTAKRKAIDRLRRTGREQSIDTALQWLESADAVSNSVDASNSIADDRLRLIFTCCHPSLDWPTQVSLTLSAVGGLPIRAIARAFMVGESAMMQRLSRAKRKIKQAGIPYRVPPDHLLPERLPGVLAVIYLIFNEGYSATGGDTLVRDDLCEEAIRLARLLASLLPDEPEVRGLLGLMLLTHARRAARVDSLGVAIGLSDQDRSLWDVRKIEEGTAIIDGALAQRRPGIYQIQGAIAALHAAARRAEETDWAQIEALYGVLEKFGPTPVIRLNRIAAHAMHKGPRAGLVAIDDLSESDARALACYSYFHSMRGELLRRMGRLSEAATAFSLALKHARNESEQAFLRARLARCEEP